MPRTLAALLALLFATLPAPAQPQDGDLILTLQNPYATVRLDPTTGACSTLAVASTIYYHTYVAMASDNRDLMVQGIQSVFRIDPTGIVVTVQFTPGFGTGPRGMGLDHDGTWIMCSYNGTVSSLFALDDRTGRLTSLYSAAGIDDELTIDRDPLTAPYVVASYPDRLYRSDRTGRTGTVATIPSWQIHGVELDPGSGSYLTLAQGAPGVALVSKTGTVTTLTQSIPRPSAARFDQDGTAWITGNATPPRMYKVDMQGTIIKTVAMSGTINRIVGVEVYGSRRIVCNGSGRPGTTVQITLSSRKAGDGGLPYLLAASLGRRPGLRMQNGERLDLAPDALFTVSALGLAPTIFQQFQGVTDPTGHAVARVAIPAALPGGSKISVFVAGVILGPRGVRTVTNTHWFVLE